MIWLTLFIGLAYVAYVYVVLVIKMVYLMVVASIKMTAWVIVMLARLMARLSDKRPEPVLVEKPLYGPPAIQ